MKLFKCVFLGLILSLLTLLFACSEQREEADKTLVVFASASLRNVMQDVADKYQQQSGISLVFNFAGSNILAKQIEASSRADVYLSANAHWMNYLSSRSLLMPGSEQVFLSNNLVVVAQKDSNWKFDSVSTMPSLPFRFLSLGNPDAVPAGRYARQYLQSINIEPNSERGSVWEAVKGRVLPAPDVRAAASMVEDMQNIIGIVYKTDALASQELKILHEIRYEENSQLERVKYLAAGLSKTGKEREENALRTRMVSSFLHFLLEEKAQKIFKRHGFKPVYNASKSVN